MNSQVRWRAAVSIRHRLNDAPPRAQPRLMDLLAEILDYGRTEEGLDLAERLAGATTGDMQMSEALTVEVIEADGCPEVRIRLSPEPPADNEPAAVQVRRGGDGLALRFRDAQAFEVFRAVVAGGP